MMSKWYNDVSSSQAGRLYPPAHVCPADRQYLSPLVADDFVAGRQQVAVLSHDFWERRFGGDPGVVGKTISLNLRPFVIIGIAPADLPSLPNSVIFRPPSQIYTPVEAQYGDENRSDRFLRGLALLKMGVSLTQAQAELDVLVAGMQRLHPKEDAGRGVRLITVKDDLVRNVRSILNVLQLAILMVVLIACANVANLLLARSTVRQREIAIRSALGAGRGRLTQQVLIESMLLALLGGSLGVLLAYWGAAVLTRLGANVLPELNGLGIDLPVLLCTLVVSVLTGMIFGAAPVVQISSMSLAPALKSGTRNIGSSLSQMRMRLGLVAIEAGLSVVLLVSAGLLLKSFVLLLRVDPGFDPNHVRMTFIYPPRLGNATLVEQQSYFRTLLARISALPGVESAGISSGVPDSGDFDNVRMKIAGRLVIPGQVPMTDRFVVSPGYFAALRIPLVSGRLLNEADDLAHPRVILVNRLLASRLFPGQDPIGQRVKIPTPGDFTGETEPDWTIVGVVGDVVQNGLGSHKTMQFYVSYSQYECAQSNLLFRTNGDPRPLASAVRGELRKIDRTLIAPEIVAMGEVLAGSIVQQRFSTTLLTVFGVTGLLLAVVGIYGVISCLVAQRLPEFGVRLALGATPFEILTLVVRQGLRPVLIGLLAGIAACFPATRLIEHLLFQTGRLDPLTLLAVVAVLVAAALLACWVPARLAMRVDPVVALRQE